MPYYSDIFHHTSKNPRFTEPPLDPKLWPPEWTTIYFKTYPRLPRIPLVKYAKPLKVSLGGAIKERRTWREFSKKQIALEDLANLLFHSAGIHRSEGLKSRKKLVDWNKTRRPHPSGGARYPLEIYPVVLRGEKSLSPGVYHYNLKENLLENLWENDLLSSGKLEGMFGDDFLLNAAVIIFITAVFERNQIKYGERGYRMILQESGHLGQNFYLVSEALGIGCCAFSGYADEMVDELLDIDGVSETTIYAFAFGPRH